MLLIGIGVVLFVHGFEDFKYALETRLILSNASFYAFSFTTIEGSAISLYCVE